jgi:hypothetical protein
MLRRTGSGESKRGGSTARWKNSAASVDDTSKPGIDGRAIDAVHESDEDEYEHERWILRSSSDSVSAGGNFRESLRCVDTDGR